MPQITPPRRFAPTLPLKGRVLPSGILLFNLDGRRKAHDKATVKTGSLQNR